MTTPTLLTLRIDDVMRSQPWPIVLDTDGSTIVSGRPDAHTIIQWASLTSNMTSMEPHVGFGPVFIGIDGQWFTVDGVYLAAEPTEYHGDLDALRTEESKRREVVAQMNRN